jgi:hypothetical protein
MNKIFFVFFLAILALFLLVKHERKSAKNEVIIEQNEETIEQQNETIQTKNFQQRIIDKTFNNVDFASRNEWLLLVFEERKTENN